MKLQLYGKGWEQDGSPIPQELCTSTGCSQAPSKHQHQLLSHDSTSALQFGNKFPLPIRIPLCPSSPQHQSTTRKQQGNPSLSPAPGDTCSALEGMISRIAAAVPAPGCRQG